MINEDIFKLRAINGLRKINLESRTVLAKINIETNADLITHKKIRAFLEEMEEVIEDFADEVGVE